MIVLKTFRLLAAVLAGAVIAHGDLPQFDTARTESRRLTLAPNLQLKVWAAEPLLSNGVAFNFDNRGRCFIAETHRYGVSVFDITRNAPWLLNDLSFRTTQDRFDFLDQTFATNHLLLTKDSEQVRLVEDTDHDGIADRGEVLASGFNSPLDGTAAGVVARNDDVWFGNIPNLWRIHRTPRGEIEKEKLASGFGVHIGVTGHDLHGLVFGPDGRLYMSFGDRGACVTNQEGKVIDLPDMGGVLRCEPGGSQLEVFCMGLRNPQDLEFDDLGNLWTVDNDTAGPDPCRVLHLVEGADYGWRCSYQHMEGFGPWVSEELWRGGKAGIMPLAGTVSQGPAGLAFYPGTGFGDSLAGKFLHCDFPGGVWSFDVKARGASFVVGRAEHFAWNCWPTDVKFGPDGAAYILDWVAGWDMPQKGRIYRITDARFSNDPEAAEVRDLLAGGIAKSDGKKLIFLLSHKDRRVRLEAQFEAVKRSRPGQPTEGNLVSALQKTALDEQHPAAQVHAINALENILRLGGNGALDFRKLLASSHPHVQAAAARVAGDRLAGKAIVPLAVLATNGAPEVRLAALLSLAKLANHPKASGLDSAFAVRTAVAALRNNTEDDDFIRHGAVSLLTSVAGAKEVVAAQFDPSPRVRIGVLLAWRRTTNFAIVQFLADPDPNLADEAIRAIHDVPIAAAFPALANVITRVDCPTNVIARVIDAAFRLGTQQHAQMLASFAKRQDVPGSARALALRALADWGKPSPIDRVIGLWRPLTASTNESMETGPAPAQGANPLLARAASAARSQGGSGIVPILPADLGRSQSYEQGVTFKRSEQPAKRAFLSVASEILDPSTPDQFGVVVGGPPAPIEVQLAVVSTALQLRTKEASTPLFARLTDTNSPKAVRLAIIAALAELRAGQTEDALTLALNSPDPDFQAAAIPYLDRLERGDSVGLLDRAIGRVISDTPLKSTPLPDSQVFLAQAALAALGRTPGGAATEVLRHSFAMLLENRLPLTLALDLTMAAKKRGAPLAQLVEARREALVQENPSLGAFHDVKFGGNPERGDHVFHQKAEVECMRCHAVRGVGGTVGPSLDGLGKRANVDQILESIALPSARFAPGFEMANLQLKDGKSLVGRIKKETAASLVIEANGETGEVEVTEVAKTDIVKRDAAPSPMPEGLAEKLTPFELRDLISYLSTLK